MSKDLKDWFFGVSEEKRKTIDSIRRLKEKYPSLKVVGRGTLVISPQEISSTKEHKEILSKAKRFANN